jgi:hypothetical protein
MLVLSYSHCRQLISPCRASPPFTGARDVAAPATHGFSIQEIGAIIRFRLREIAPASMHTEFGLACAGATICNRRFRRGPASMFLHP